MAKIKHSNKDLLGLPDKYCRVVLTDNQPNWHRLVETPDGTLEYRLGTGAKKDLTARRFRTMVRKIVQAAKAHQLARIALTLQPADYPQLEELGRAWFYRTVAENLALADYEFCKYKRPSKDTVPLQEILVCNLTSKADITAFTTGLTVAAGANTTRDIANTAGVDMTPSKLAKAAQAAMRGTAAKVKVLGSAEIKREKMGLLEVVGKGACDKPRLIVIEYWGAGKSQSKKQRQPIALIGKGITYDSGGLNVKPSGAMHDMHLDMSGGAAMIGAMQAIATLGLKQNVIAIIPAAENSISADSMRAGDIATAMNGSTVEILHTDAEGRLVLADALTYAEKHYQPRVILDAATLTGAALVALGQHASALLTKDDALRSTLLELGERSGDLVWPLPLWDEYKESLKSARADIANIAVNFSRYGGTIEGGTFLAHFAPPKTPWAHIDIAPRMESIKSDHLAKGATGEPVRLLVQFVEEY